MDKRGISTVIATILIVVITIGAAGVIWKGVRVIVERSKDMDSDCLDADLSIETSAGYTCYDSNIKGISIQVGRGSDKVNMTKIEFLINSGGDSVKIIKPVDLKQNQKKTYYFDLSTLNEKVEKISIAPVIRVEGKEKTCKIVSSVGVTKSCDLGSTTLEKLPCSDGTIIGACSSTKPKYCDSNTNLIDKCHTCGCLSGYTCKPGIDECLVIDPEDPDTCSDGTPYDSCSSTQPKYCDSSSKKLINNCVGCGCPTGYKCNSDGTCSAIVCTDGTPYETCSSTKPKYCDSSSTLINNCQVCGCASGYTCNSDGSCSEIICTDGTPYETCSSTKPKYCDSNGDLINNCQVCGCASGYKCEASGSCSSTTCTDGTAHGSCSSTKPLYCDNGNLINKCTTCGCPTGYKCNSDGSCSEIICTDGTIPGSCSSTKPKYCDSSGDLINNCQVCGCASGYKCNSDGTCSEIICSDGTIPGSCSSTKPLYCDNGDLIDDCQLCGCASGYVCETNGSCSSTAPSCSGSKSYNTPYGVSCSSTRPFSLCSYSKDNQVSTGWYSAAVSNPYPCTSMVMGTSISQSITFDLLSNRCVSGIRIYVDFLYGGFPNAQLANIAISDGGGYKTVATNVLLSNGGSWNYVTFNEKVARYVKVNFICTPLLDVNVNEADVRYRDVL